LDELRKDYEELVVSKTKNDEDIQDLMNKIEEEKVKQKTAMDELVYVKEEVNWKLNESNRRILMLIDVHTVVELWQSNWTLLFITV
jgi:hypothetical protein